MMITHQFAAAGGSCGDVVLRRSAAQDSDPPFEDVLEESLGSLPLLRARSQRGLGRGSPKRFFSASGCGLVSGLPTGTWVGVSRTNPCLVLSLERMQTEQHRWCCSSFVCKVGWGVLNSKDD